MTATGSGRARATLLVYVAGALVAVKLAATAVLIKDGGGIGPLLAFGPGLWLDAALWGGLWWATWPLRASRRALWLLPAAVLVALFSAGSWTSFLVTHTWMTWQRLRGDDQVQVGDIGELDASYALPMLALMLLLLLWVGGAWSLAGRVRVEAWLAQRRVGVGAAVAAGLMFLVDLQTAPLGLYGLSEQPLVEFAESVFIPRERETEPLSDKEWRRLHQPTVTSSGGEAPPPLRQPPKNLVVYLAEGIATKHTTFGGEWDTTPNVHRRWKDHGLLFDQFYALSHRSIHAIFSVVCSEYPPPTEDAITALHPRADCGSMMETLSGVEGMHQGLFHGGRFAFANKLALLGGRGFEVMKDAQDLSDPERWDETWWGIDDRAVVDAALAFVDSIPADERFFLFIIPIAPHEPYDTPASSDVPSFAPKTSGRNQKFLRSVAFADAAFERLMKGLEARGRYDDTLTVWVPDHGNHEDEPPRPTRGKRMLYQHNVHVPLVLLHPPSFSGQSTSRVGGQLDLAPTLTAALGAPADPKDRGQDLLSAGYEPRRVFLLTTRGNDPFVGLVDGHFKFTYDIHPRRWELYDLRTDPDERKNIAAEHVARARRYAADGVRLRSAQRQTLLALPPLDEKVGTEEEVFAAAKLTCAGGPCPAGASMEVATCKGKWATRPCLRLKAPAGTTLEVELPGALVGRYDSVRVRWWQRERQKMARAKLALHYGGREIPPNPPWHKNEIHRVLPVPHTPEPGAPAVRVTLHSDVAHEPVIELVEH